MHLCNITHGFGSSWLCRSLSLQGYGTHGNKIIFHRTKNHVLFICELGRVSLGLLASFIILSLLESALHYLEVVLLPMDLQGPQQYLHQVCRMLAGSQHGLYRDHHQYLVYHFKAPKPTCLSSFLLPMV